MPDAVAPVAAAVSVAADATPPASGIDSTVAAPAPVDSPIWLRLRNGFSLGEPSHPRIDAEVRRLQRHPAAFMALMSRAEPYLYHMLGEIEAAGLPAELALLPAVESGFQPYAHSPNGAAGLWQFMPATGASLGLTRDWWFDKRRTVRQSTNAAIVYLDRLQRRFDGDWLHALAAYNAGAARVGRAIRRAERAGRPTAYWSLDLPAETDNYIPRLFALVRIVNDPDRFGLTLPDIPDRPYFELVDTDGQLDLQVAARLAGITIDELLDLNAGHRRWSTPPDGPHVLLLPEDAIERFRAGLATLPPDQRVRWRRHVVQRGDSLSRIARQYDVSVAAIQRANGLTDSRIRAGSHLVVPLTEEPILAGSPRSGRQQVRYKVRKGDSLYSIARRFQVSIADLRRWNQVGRFIHPGERLTLYIDPDA